jgi:hypothetical protein
VEVVAVKPGTGGNVAAGRINAIDGPLGLQLAVTNPKPAEGGSVSQRAAVSADDRVAIREQLLAQLVESGSAALTAQLRPGEFLAAGTTQVAETLAETYDHALDEPADAVALTLRIALTGLAIDEADVRLVAEAALAAQLTAGESLASQIRVEHQSTGGLDELGRAHLTLRAVGAATARLNLATVRESVAGRTVLGARDHLAAALPLAEPPRIDVWPDWYGRLPFLVFRIKVAGR